MFGGMFSKCHLKHCMHLNVTKLNIRSMYTKYSSEIITVPVAYWLASFLFDSYIPGSIRVGRNFIFQKISGLKGHWNVPAIQSTEW